MELLHLNMLHWRPFELGFSARHHKSSKVLILGSVTSFNTPVETINIWRWWKTGDSIPTFLHPLVIFDSIHQFQERLYLWWWERICTNFIFLFCYVTQLGVNYIRKKLSISYKLYFDYYFNKRIIKHKTLIFLKNIVIIC